jgi:hypothetical protein
MLLDRELSVRGVSDAAIRDFQSHLLGDAIRPQDAAYDSARQVWNRAIDRRPALVVRAADAADVIRSVSFARDNELPLAVRSGGHSMAGHSTVDDGIVIDLSRMQGMSVDADRRVAWVQPGLTWGGYAERAHAYGLGTTSGDSGTVGIGGLALGGGVGWMVRKYGLTVDNMLSAEIVTADGRLVRASADEHPDLFWALRGGGGNFGVATAFQFNLHPAGTILGGGVIYPATREVLRGWADYAPQAPEELTTIVFIMKAPPLPFIPAEHVGKLIALIGYCYAGDLDEGQRALEPLRNLATPLADLTSPMPYPGMFELTREAAQPQPHFIRAGFMPAFDDGSIDAIVEHGQRMPVPTGLIQLRGLGGAMARVPSDATAFAHRDKPFFASVIGGYRAPQEAEPQFAWMQGLWSELEPKAEGVYVNFLEDEGERRVRQAYSTLGYRRLAEVKRRYDPQNLFNMNQNIRPAVR